MAGVSDILTAIQNGVIAVNNLSRVLQGVTLTSTTGLLYINTVIISSTTLPSS